MMLDLEKWRSSLQRQRKVTFQSTTTFAFDSIVSLKMHTLGSILRVKIRQKETQHFFWGVRVSAQTGIICYFAALKLFFSVNLEILPEVQKIELSCDCPCTVENGKFPKHFPLCPIEFVRSLNFVHFFAQKSPLSLFLSTLSRIGDLSAFAWPFCGLLGIRIAGIHFIFVMSQFIRLHQMTRLFIKKGASKNRLSFQCTRSLSRLDTQSKYVARTSKGNAMQIKTFVNKWFKRLKHWIIFFCFLYPLETPLTKSRILVVHKLSHINCTVGCKSTTRA